MSTRGSDSSSEGCKAFAELSSGKGLRRRFYEKVILASQGDDYLVLLDGKQAKTPGKQPIILPHRDLAYRVVEEWQKQGIFIEPATMPMTRLVNTVIDLIATSRESVIAEIVAYAASDMLCYRADSPESLCKIQEELWAPVHLWAEESLGISMPVSFGIIPIQIPLDSLSRIQSFLSGMDDFTLGAFVDITQLTGSFLLSLALFRNYLSVDKVWDLAHLDEDWQMEQWGHDEDAMKRRRQRHLEMEAAVFLLHCPIIGEGSVGR